MAVRRRKARRSAPSAGQKGIGRRCRSGGILKQAAVGGNKGRLSERPEEQEMEKSRIFIGEARLEAEERETTEPKTQGRMQRQKLLSLLGRRLLYRIVLEEYGTDLSLEQEPLAAEPLGKPYLRSHRDIFFNISHSEARVVCAVGSVPLGIDIQYHRTVQPERLDRMAVRFLSPRELEQYREASRKAESFYHFWTKKESYLKYTGEGIRRNLGELAYEGCRFLPLQMPSGWSGMLCVPEEWAGEIRWMENFQGGRGIQP